MALINLRNALMTGKRLPYDAEVEYLQSSGTQYINTGLKYFPDFDVSIEVPSGQRNATIYCDATHTLERIGSSTPYWQIYAGDRLQSSVSVYGFHRVQFQSATLTIDGQTIGSLSNRTWAEGTTCYIGFNGNNAYVYKLYACKMWDANGVLVRDYIPVRVGTVGYLYDRVTGKLFGNAGTGDFVLGPDVVPVEYIESRSNHAQIIDTGFYANQNTKSLITFEKLVADGWLFGSRNGSSSATDKFGIFAYQSPDGKISAQVGNVYIEPIISGGLTYRKKTIELSLADGVTVDGETIATFSESQKSQTFTSTYPMALFNMRVSSSGFNSGIYCRVYAYQIFENGLITRNFLPVRVGTDATSWEGAMMDVLTRRIYRNAGTGAFAYGNDLKYPIPAE